MAWSNAKYTVNTQYMLKKTHALQPTAGFWLTPVSLNGKSFLRLPMLSRRDGISPLGCS